MIEGNLSAITTMFGPVRVCLIIVDSIIGAWIFDYCGLRIAISTAILSIVEDLIVTASVGH